MLDKSAKDKKSGNEWRQEKCVGVEILERVASRSQYLYRKLEGSKRENHVDICGNSTSEGGNSNCKTLEAYSRNSEKASAGRKESNEESTRKLRARSCSCRREGKSGWRIGLY